jgi:hypothetical protein
MTEPRDNETVEGMVWPIVLLVELPPGQTDTLTKQLQGASAIVLVEGSMLRAAQQVRSQRPDVVVAPAALETSGRTQVLRDAAREIGIEVMFVPAGTPHDVIVAHVMEELRRASQSKMPTHSSRGKK